MFSGPQLNSSDSLMEIRILSLHFESGDFCEVGVSVTPLLLPFHLLNVLCYLESFHKITESQGLEGASGDNEIQVPQHKICRKVSRWTLNNFRKGGFTTSLCSFFQYSNPQTEVFSHVFMNFLYSSFCPFPLVPSLHTREEPGPIPLDSCTLAAYRH